MTSPLSEALRRQRAAARQGFDWTPAMRRQMWKKLDEEIAELHAVTRDPHRAEDELGDLLFMVVNLARHLGINADRALSRANRKFSRRFSFILRHRSGLPPLGDKRRLAAMEKLWRQAKQRGL